MLRKINECVGCADDFHSCIGCPRKTTIRLFCDRCGEDSSVLYEKDGEQLCKTCLLAGLPSVTPENAGGRFGSHYCHDRE